MNNWPASTSILYALQIFLFGLSVNFANVPASEAQDSDELVETTIKAVVGLRSVVPDHARTAFSLGTERQGNGIVIDDDGLVLTIGYLILEASDIEVTDSQGQYVPAELVAFDYDSGFGLVKAKQPLGIKSIPLGVSQELALGDPTLILSHIGPDYMQVAEVVDVREFPGYWEYLLDRAIFTAPLFDGYGGAALINTEGKLVGVGSLMVHDARRGTQPQPGNMFVPIDLLKPIFEDLLNFGRASGTPRPWLGIYTAIDRGHLFVYRLATDGPGEEAGIRPNDIIVAVNGNSVSDLAEFLREVWATGAAGIDVHISIVRQGQLMEITVKSQDRYDWLKFDSISQFSATLKLKQTGLYKSLRLTKNSGIGILYNPNFTEYHLGG